MQLDLLESRERAFAAAVCAGLGVRLGDPLDFGDPAVLALVGRSAGMDLGAFAREVCTTAAVILAEEAEQPAGPVSLVRALFALEVAVRLAGLLAEVGESVLPSTLGLALDECLERARRAAPRSLAGRARLVEQTVAPLAASAAAA